MIQNRRYNMKKLVSMLLAVVMMANMFVAGAYSECISMVI